MLKRTNRKSSLLLVNTNIILTEGFGSMQAPIDDVFSTHSSCRKCHTRSIPSTNYGPCLVIDLTITSCPNSRKELPQRKECILSEISKNIKVASQSYLLVGSIHYIHSGKQGHYVAYVLNGNRWYVYNDLADHVRHATPDTRMNVN